MVERRGKRNDSYPSRGQPLAIRVWAHGQGTVEPHASISGRVSVLWRQKDNNLIDSLDFINRCLNYSTI